MGVKRKIRLLSLTLSSAGEDESKWFPTENYSDFSFVLRMGDSTYTSTDVADTVDVWVEGSDTDDSSQHASNYRALDLVDPADNTVSKQFDQVTGNLTLASDTRSPTALRQQRDYKSPNIDPYIRAKHKSVGTVADLGKIILDVYATETT